MKTHQADTVWKYDQVLEAEINGHRILMDGNAPGEIPSEGPTPKPLLLAALGGCTSLDVLSIIKKSHRALQSFQVQASGNLSEGIPSVYTALFLKYEANGDADMEAAFLRAVQLSLEKYCGVAFMLQKIMPLSYSVIFNGRQLYESVPAEPEAWTLLPSQDA